LSHLIATLKPYLDQYGYWAVFGAILLEGFAVPMPGETVLIVASFLASRGDMHITPVLVLAWGAVIAGSNIGYAIGRFGGRLLVLRFGRYVFINQKRLEYVETFFRGHGRSVVLVAYFFDVLRQLNGIVAGIAEMPWWRFLFYNALGGALWVGFWGLLAYQLGERVTHLGYVFKRIELFLLGGIIISIAGLTIYLVRQRKR
jgi:membrane protein DedA with SNARE-associated domain